MKEKLLIWSIILSAPSFVIGHLASLPWLTFLGALLIVPFAVVGIVGFIWTLIDQ